MDSTPANKLTELQASQSRKMEALGRLTSGIAHEINSPMQYLGDNTSFLKSVYGDLFDLLNRYRALVNEVKKGGVPSPSLLQELEAIEKRVEPDYLQTEILKTIDQSLEGIDRVVKIIMALKEFARPLRQGAASADLNRAIQNTITLARREWKYVADLDLDLEETLPRVHCQIDEMNQVVLNLVVNAAQAIKEKIDAGGFDHGKIVIKTRILGNDAVLSVSDDGPGILPANQARIFEPFFTTKDPGKGTGQGLAIVWDIVVRKHGGTIAVESSPGAGASFVVKIPFRPPAPISSVSANEPKGN